MYFRKHPLRAGAVFLIILSCFVIFSVKLSLIQVFRASYLADKADKQHNRLVDLEPKRGTIYDRNMHALALNVASYSVFVNPRAMTAAQKSQAAQVVGKALGQSSQCLMT